MRLSVFEQNLSNKLKEAIRDVTPGVYVRAYHGGRLYCDVAVGDTYPYYDLASLTKIIFTNQLMMELFDQGHWNLETKVKDILKDYPHENILIKNLMTHTAGHVWWAPFYKDLDVKLSLAKKRKALYEFVKSSPLENTEKAIYSDLDYWLLGEVLQELLQKDLVEIWNQTKSKYYEGTNFEFNVNNEPPFAKKLYAPTEECPWRKRLIQGEVHDENTWSLGGIATHAGLFGSIDDLASYMLLLRSQLMGIAKYSIRQKTVQLFAERALRPEVGDWSMGFMLPTPGFASCGQYFSAKSIGHLGFTGTSVWYDPKEDLIVGVLSNRTLYGRDLEPFRKLRPLIHNWVFEGIKRV